MGKTSCAASLAVKFANEGYPTLVVSTDPAHSLGDSLGQVRGPPAVTPLLLAPLVCSLGGHERGTPSSWCPRTPHTRWATRWAGCMGGVRGRS